MQELNAHLDALSQHTQTTEAQALARKFAPVLRFDAAEPFLPLGTGYTIFREAAKSPSTQFIINPEGGIAIEYAIWWDWDIQHLYELEHVWVYLDADENIIKVEASAHGKLRSMQREDSSLPIENDRITVYSEPGKHAFAPQSRNFVDNPDGTIRCCGEHAGKDDIPNNDLTRALITQPTTPLQRRLAKRFLQRNRFTPTFEFTQVFDCQILPFVEWSHLAEWITQRIALWQKTLPQNVPHLHLICLDSGDTMVDESTEVKD